MKIRVSILSLFMLAACAKHSSDAPSATAPTPSSNVQNDGSIVRGRAVVNITTSDIEDLSLQAMANSGSATVTYINSPSVNFEIDPSQLVAGAMTGNTLSLGHVSVKALSDNNLNLCGTGGNKKCTTAEIRVYTTGDVAGFVNTSETPNYGLPVYASGLNPTVAIPLNSPGTAVQQYTNIPASKHNLKLSDFPNPSYNVTSDFTEAGSGTYKMTFVVEYALKP